MKTIKEVIDTSLFDKLVAETPIATNNFIDHSLEIAHQIEMLMEQRGMLQKDLAHALGKSEAEISKWLCGFHNFTIKTISKVEAVLDAKIITTPYKVEIEKTETVNNVSIVLGRNSVHINSGSFTKILSDEQTFSLVA